MAPSDAESEGAYGRRLWGLGVSTGQRKTGKAKSVLSALGISDMFSAGSWRLVDIAIVCTEHLSFLDDEAYGS